MKTERLPVKWIVSALKMDPDLSILFVEEERDVAFWRMISPIINRKYSKIYPIQRFDISEVKFDGCKGRIIELASILGADKDNLGRCRFFVDADNDHILGKNHPEGVILTDYRDLESYGFNDGCLNKIINFGLAKDEFDVAGLIGRLSEVCFPIGVLRALSRKHEFNIVFGKTFNNNGRKKYISNPKKITLNLSSLLKTLLQNTGISLKELPNINSELNAMMNSLSNIDIRKIIHGKDWLYFFALVMGIDDASTESLLFTALEPSHCLPAPALTVVKNFLERREE